MRRMIYSIGLVLLVHSVVSFSAIGQTTPPSRPRILFDAAAMPQILARAQTPGTRASEAWASMVTTAAWQAPSQSAWTTLRSLRRMEELAVRHALTGNVSQGQNAKALLLSAVSSFVPTAETPYSNGTQPAVIAATYDLLHPLLSTTERAQVVAHLQSWVNVLTPASSVVGSYQSYSGCTDNYSFGWAGALVVTLLAIWGDSSIPDIPSRVTGLLEDLHLGWQDAVCPDGSHDESFGYMNYGTLWSLWGAMAAQRCGFPDAIAGTNIVRTPRWLASGVFREGTRWSLPWLGDSSPLSQGLKWDPILYHLVTREQDAVGLWVLDQVFRSSRGEPIGDNSTTWAFSPHVNVLLLAPDNSLVPSAPALRSGFFRDNENLAPATINRTTANAAVGEGGVAFLRNTSDPWSETGFAVTYMIRDEWANHGHEDDGHLCVATGGVRQFIDRGYDGTAGAQDTSHNLVTVQSAGSFLGASNNYYTPPSPDGRYRGRLVARHLAPALDYVRGDHGVMWRMEKAHRTVVLVKDPVRPFSIVFDELRKASSGTHTYEQRWTTPVAMTGAGTVANPFQVTNNGVPFRLAYVDSPSLTFSPGTSATTVEGVVYRHNVARISASGQVTLLGVHHGSAMSGVSALAAPSGNCRGGSLTWPGGFTHKIMARIDSSPISDASTDSDGEFLWIKSDALGGVDAFAVGEGTYLAHGGVTLFTSSVPLCCSVSGSRIDLSWPAGSASVQPPLVSVRWSGVSEVYLEGEPIAFSVAGALVQIGGPPAPPPPSSDDRFYAFTTGAIGDGAIGPGTLVLANGEILAVGPDAWFAPKGGAALSAEPVHFGVSFRPGADAFGLVGRWSLGNTFGSDDLAALELRYELASGGSVVLRVGGSADTLVLPLGILATSSAFRVGLDYDPRAGWLALIDSQGRTVGTLSVRQRVEPYSGRLDLLPGATFDDVSLFGSEENGTTPRGVASWTTSSGRLGFAIHAPDLGLGGGLFLTVGGVSVPSASILPTLLAVGFSEFLSTSVSVPGLGPSPERRDVAFESLLPVLPVGGSPAIVVGYTSITGTVFSTVVVP